MNELEIIRHAQMDGLSIFFDTVDYRTPHMHPEWELVLVLERDLTVTCGRDAYTVQPGQLVLFHPNEPHEFHKTGESCTFLCLQISSDILPELPPVQIDERLPHQHLTPGKLEGIRLAMGDILAAYLAREDHFGLYCVGKSSLLLHELLTSLPTHIRTQEETDSIDKRNARLQRLIRFVDENFMQKIRLADFAVAEGCSVSYLSRFIKQTMNQSFQEYVTSVRFHCACKLIAAGGKRMLEVCMESGFSDYRYFSREFRRQYGMTPEAYSIYANRRQLEPTAVRHSLHSIERFYTKAESLNLARQFNLLPE